MPKNENCARRLVTRSNRRDAKRLWGEILEQRHLRLLQDLTDQFGFAVARGEIQLLNGKWYVTHAGLLNLAERRHCAGIKVQQVREFCDPGTSRWVFKAIVYNNPTSKGFVGYGDADPSNTSPLVRGAEMRVAETRAVNRALRKAYGIGLCSVEELGSRFDAASVARGPEQRPSSKSQYSSNGQTRLRDRLCLLIRQHNLDPTLVKAYAADFCGTETLSGATRDLVESFIAHLGTAAKENKDALICKLNSYAQSSEVRS